MRLDEREFAAIDQAITAAQNDYIVGHLRVAGALEVFEGLGPDKPTEFSIKNAQIDLVTKIFISGQKSFILAGCLTETGKKWSRLEADRNAARFNEITDQADLDLMTSLVVKAVIDFFQHAVQSLETSRKAASSPSEEVPATKSTAPE